MKTSNRFLPFRVAALVLGTAGVTLPGCSKNLGPLPQSTPPAKVKSKACQGPPTTVTVLVENDGRTANKVAYACEEKDAIEWVPADDTTYVSDDIQWKTTSPFGEKPKHETNGKKTVLKSKPPKKGTAGQGFDYDAWLVLKDGTKKKIDPRIEVME